MNIFLVLNKVGEAIHAESEEITRIFDSLTVGKCIIMGETKYKQIKEFSFPERTTFVVGSSEGVYEDVCFVKSLNYALQCCQSIGKDTFVVSGDYTKLNFVSTIFLFTIDTENPGTEYPFIDRTEWKNVYREDYKSFVFEVLEPYVSEK